ncbi:MAG: hypothetical protein ACRDOO_09275 [Actinomadura sp.]
MADPFEGVMDTCAFAGFAGPDRPAAVEDTVELSVHAVVTSNVAVSRLPAATGR